MTDQGSAPTGQMQPCPLCREPVQVGAKKCPHCREYLDPAAAPKAEAPPKKSSSARSCIALLLLIVCVAVFWYLWAPRSNKDTVNRVLAQTGVTVTPWIDRADTAMRDMLAKPKNQSSIASSIAAQTHPSGNTPTLARWSVDKQGQTLSVTFDVGWKGGLIGTDYVIQVVWRCNEAGPIGATVTQDNAPVGAQDADSQRRLEEYFRTGVWPALFDNSGGK